MGDTPFRMWVWEPKKLNWWIAGLFMAGASLFALGCVLYLCAIKHEFALDSVFFAGSIFFTSAAYLQFHQSFSVNRLVFWSAFAQFIGTLMFNMNTFDAFLNLDWIEQDLLIWTPNMVGSILFQASGTIALLEMRRRLERPRFQGMEWRIGVINFAGCVAFLMSAFLSFVIEPPVSTLLATCATVCTLAGACCFFIGAFLMWGSGGPADCDTLPDGEYHATKRCFGLTLITG